MSVTYRYRAHGLTLDSEIELPELSAFDGAPDVVIRYGPAPERLDGPLTRGPGYQAAPGRLLLHLPGIARYWVRDGRDVTIEPVSTAAAEDIRVFVLSSVMGAVAHQRGLLAMHASAVDVDGRCVLFAGDSGSGKSTLTAAFHDRGHGVITDDLALVGIDGRGDPVVQPGSRHVKLWADSLQYVGRSLGARQKVRVGMRKYSAMVTSPAPTVPARLALMFVLNTRPVDAIRLRPLAGRAKVAALLRETYRRRMLAALGGHTAHFSQCTELGRRLQVVEVDRPTRLDAIDQLADVLEDRIREAPGTPA